MPQMSTRPRRLAPAGHHVVRFNVRFRNMTNQPLSLGYKASTSKATDNFGNPYYWGRPGTHDTNSSGIGLVTSNSAAPARGSSNA